MEPLIEQASKSKNPKILALALKLAKHPVSRFRPRPDQPHLLDQQSIFFHDRFDGIACALGGTGSGKSFCGAAHVAKFLAETPPPEKNTPFWVLSNTMAMVTDC